ncbi:MAG TPA: type II secretion system protein [Pirellulales bacterium]|nr:type II secretion system protein [Pirellulales bacterium]
MRITASGRSNYSCFHGWRVVAKPGNPPPTPTDLSVPMRPAASAAVSSNIARRGLTLLEIVVVVAILAALAGMLLPLFSGILTDARTSSAATNGTEINKIVRIYYTQYSRYPNYLDDIGGGTGTPLSIVPGATSPDYVPIPVSTATSQTLTTAGITSCYPIVATISGSTTWSPTFFPYTATSSGLPVSEQIASISALVGITPLAAAREFGVASTVAAINSGTSSAQFAVFGLGQYSSMTSTVMVDAPVHFDDHSTGRAGSAYARFGLVFQLADDSGNPLTAAKFIGTVAFSEYGPKTVGDELNEFYKLQATP